MTTPTKDQIKRFYSQSLERSLAGYAQLDDKEWAKKVSDHWTAKEHLAYLTGTLEEQAIPLVRKALAGEPGTLPDFERRDQERDFNNRSVEKLRDLPPSELIDRTRAAVGEHIGILDGLSESDLDRPAMDPGWDRPGTVRDLYCAAYLLFPNQYQSIRRANKKKLPHWITSGTTEQAHYHIDRLFNFMPLIYRSHDHADFAATYHFDMEGPAGGQWWIKVANGRADTTDSSTDGYDAEIKTKPELWMDLASGDLNPMVAITTRKVKLGGNLATALKLSSLFGSTG